MHLPHPGARETDPRGPEAEEFAKRIPIRSLERQVALEVDPARWWRAGRRRSHPSQRDAAREVGGVLTDGQMPFQKRDT